MNMASCEDVAESRAFWLLKLMRIALVPTACADVLAGFFLSLPTNAKWEYLDVLGLAFISAMVYCAGMVMNSLFDLQKDQQTAPDRVLASGMVSVRTAVFVLFALLGLAFCRAALFGPKVLVIFGWLLLAVALYNGLLKTWGLGGAIMMGTCRFFNVLLGMSLVDGASRPLFFPVLLGIYVASVTAWSLGEDVEKQSRWLWIGGVGVCACWVAIAVWSGWEREANALVILALAIWTGPDIWRALQKTSRTKRVLSENVGKTVHRLLFGIMGLDACALLQCGHPVAACVVLVLCVAMFWMQKKRLLE